jgi:hypothetical protein
MSESEIIRGRNCIVFFKGDSQTVIVSQGMVNGGWPGGQGVMWVDSSSDERVVSYSSGLYGGILVWGSDEPADQFTATTLSQTRYRYATMFSGGALIATTSFEKYTYASRTGGAPLVPLVYGSNDILYFSRRGLWTKEDEMTLSGDSSAPAFFTGFVAQIPKSLNSMFMGIQTSL